ncbi:calcium-binding protein [Sphingobium sp. AN558]|uniref:calcium-binding protein n=1 Tax=Sphingobium sp. AN558 TaxID=3133442 RepID=UPI0030BDFE1B
MDISYIGLATSTIYGMSNDTQFVLKSTPAYGLYYTFIGSGLTYASNGIVESGTITEIDFSFADGTPYMTWTAGSLSGADFTYLMNSYPIRSTVQSTFLADDDTIYGNDAGAKISSGSGNDTIFGGASRDEFQGGTGNDTIFGGGGDDILYGGLENTLGGNDRLFGGEGNDQLFGATGDDILDGGSGADMLSGGTYVDAGFDIASYQSAMLGIERALGATYGTGDAAGDIFENIDGMLGSLYPDILVGRDADGDWLDGSEGNDWLLGLGGDDQLSGGNGNDVLNGGPGADHIDGGEGLDVAFYGTATAGVTASLTDGGTAGEALGDGYSQIENIWGSGFNDVLSGDGGDNQIYGFAGNDMLQGGAGDDILYGGGGSDTLTGGAGEDSFFFLSWHDHFNGYNAYEAGEGGDTIADFTSGKDIIMLSRYQFGFGDVNGPAAALTADKADFITDNMLTSDHPSLLWNADTGVLMFDPDGTGDTSALLLATLQQGAALSMADIWSA